MARKEKEPVHHVEMTDGKRAIIQQIFQEYDIESTNDIQDVLKDLFGGSIQEIMEAEMDDHPGYGSMIIDVPQDRESTFEPKVVKKTSEGHFRY